MDIVQNDAISFSNGPSDDRPYFPIVNAIAPKAPIGAKRMTISTMRNTTLLNDCNIYVEAVAGFHDVSDNQSDHQSQCRNNFEIEKCFATDASHLTQVAHAGDSGDHRAEDHQRDDHGDNPDEGVSQGLHRYGAGGAHIPEDCSESDPHSHLCPHR